MLLPLIVVPLQVAPVGKPSTLVIVAFVAVMLTSVISVLRQIVCVATSTLTSGNGLTVMLIVSLSLPQLGVWSLVPVTVIV